MTTRPLCHHRPTGPWARIWSHFLVITLGTFLGIEGYALLTEGYPATLSAFLHRLGGQEEHCRHAHLSRLLIVALCGWAAVHLGWGALGWDPRHPHKHALPTPQEP